jgi:hypothetical protein
MGGARGDGPRLLAEPQGRASHGKGLRTCRVRHRVGQRRAAAAPRVAARGREGHADGAVAEVPALHLQRAVALRLGREAYKAVAFGAAGCGVADDLARWHAAARPGVWRTGKWGAEVMATGPLGCMRPAYAFARAHGELATTPAALQRSARGAGPRWVRPRPRPKRTLALVVDAKNCLKLSSSRKSVTSGARSPTNTLYSACGCAGAEGDGGPAVAMVVGCAFPGAALTAAGREGRPSAARPGDD